MTQKLLIKLLIGALIIGGIGGAIFIVSNKKQDSQVTRDSKPSSQVQEKKISFSEMNVCDSISKELIEEAIGRKIVKVEKALSNGCDYYTDYKENFFGPESPGGPHILIGYSKEDYEKIKEDLSRPGIDNEFLKDDRISVNHYLIKSRVGKVWEVDLFLKGGGYLGIKSNYEAATGEELIKIALKIIEKKPELFSEGIKEGQSEKTEGVPLPQEEDIIHNFVNLIEEGRPDDAVKIMKVRDESELQAWAVQFSNITSFKLLEIERANENEWTDTKHIYKVVLDVWMDPRSANAPIPYYGWENGQNVRWITLEMVNNSWKISQINTGP
ncbi:MAG: hypothetical protein ABIK78_07130 [candidate division WOR-3 bacterium]